MNQDQQSDRRLEVAVNSNDRYRARARSVAALCAAAAGALSAGLILTPGGAIPTLAQFSGLTSITLLIVATALGVAASSATSYEKVTSKMANWFRLIEVWRIRTSLLKTSEDKVTVEQRIGEARQVRTGIDRLFSLSLWAAAAAAIALIVALTVATIPNGSSRFVSVQFKVPFTSSTCPALDRVFNSVVRDEDLFSSASILPMVVSAEQCGSADDVTVYLERADILIIDESAS